MKGELYTYPAMRNMKHAETGVRERREVQVTVRNWWWRDMAGTHFLIVKYGHKKLELQEGKPSIEVGAADQLITQDLCRVKTMHPITHSDIKTITEKDLIVFIFFDQSDERSQYDQQIDELIQMLATIYFYTGDKRTLEQSAAL